MSDADQAFKAAQAEIHRVRETGEERLALMAKTYNALTRLPEEIGTLGDVTYIELNNTQITDLTHRAHSTASPTSPRSQTSPP